MKPLTFQQKLAMEGQTIIVLLQSRTNYNASRFAFVEMTLHEYKKLLHSPSSYTKAEKHGKIILQGKGAPTEEMHQRISSMCNKLAS